MWVTMKTKYKHNYKDCKQQSIYQSIELNVYQPKVLSIAILGYYM